RRDDDLIAGADESGKRGMQRMLGTRGDDNLLGSVGDAVSLLIGTSDGSTQLRNAVGGSVLCMAFLHRLDRGGADVFRRGEVRFAEGEVVNGLALAPQLACESCGSERSRRLHGARHARK